MFSSLLFKAGSALASRLHSILFVLVLLLICSAGGYLYGLSSAKEAREVQQSKAVAAAEQILRKEYEKQIAQSHKSVTSLRQQKARLAQTVTQLEREIDRVSNNDCAVSRGFVRVFNRAIGADLPAGDSATRVDRKTSTAHAADPSGSSATDGNERSDINQSDILYNVAHNGSRCQAIEAQLNGLIDYLEQVNESRTKAGTGN